MSQTESDLPRLVIGRGHVTTVPRVVRAVVETVEPEEVISETESKEGANRCRKPR
jgi:hypothetical protein